MFAGPFSPPNFRGQDHGHAVGADSSSAAGIVSERRRAAAESARRYGPHRHASL